MLKIRNFLITAEPLESFGAIGFPNVRNLRADSDARLISLPVAVRTCTNSGAGEDEK